MKFFVFALILAMTVSGCNKKKSSSSSVANNGIVTTANGSVIAGNVQINQICGTNQAQIQLYSYNSQQPMYSASAPIGGTYQFQVTPGSYTLYATAGSSCVVSGPVQAIQGQVKYYDLSISNYGTGTGGYPIMYKSSAVCDLGEYGCKANYAGTGDSVFSQIKIYVNNTKPTTLNVKINPLSSSTLLTAIPAHGSTGWDVSYEKGSQLNVQGAVYPNLTYSLQVNSESLQSERGFCNSSQNIVTDMTEYLKNSGFNVELISDIKSQLEAQIPFSTKTVCAYPQEINELNKTIELVSSQSAEIQRVWFLLVPQMEEAKITNKDQYQKYAKYFKQKPATDALVAIRSTPKSRNVASSPETVTLQEWGIGFLIEK